LSISSLLPSALCLLPFAIISPTASGTKLNTRHTPVPLLGGVRGGFRDDEQRGKSFANSVVEKGRGFR